MQNLKQFVSNNKKNSHVKKKVWFLYTGKIKMLNILANNANFGLLSSCEKEHRYSSPSSKSAFIDGGAVDNPLIRALWIAWL